MLPNTPLLLSRWAAPPRVLSPHTCTIYTRYLFILYYGESKIPDAVERTQAYTPRAGSKITACGTILLIFLLLLFTHNFTHQIRHFLLGKCCPKINRFKDILRCPNDTLKECVQMLHSRSKWSGVNVSFMPHFIFSNIVFTLIFE